VPFDRGSWVYYDHHRSRKATQPSNRWAITESWTPVLKGSDNHHIWSGGMAVATARLPKSQAGTSSGEDSNQVTYLALPNDLDEDEDMPDDEPGNPDMPTKGNPLKSGSNRGISLSGHCTWKSALTPTLPSEGGLRTNTTRHVSECADVKSGAKLETGVCGGRDGTSSLPVFRTPSQCGPCTYSENIF